jgi:hypothetical protein
MTKKDYILIAKTIREWAEFHVVKNNANEAAYRDLKIGFAYALRETNPNYDETRFLTACEIIEDSEV